MMAMTHLSKTFGCSDCELSLILYTYGRIPLGELV